jgi:hypothetical protein
VRSIDRSSRFGIGVELPAILRRGIRVVTVAEQPDLWSAAYDPVALQAIRADGPPGRRFPRAMGARPGCLAGGNVLRAVRDEIMRAELKFVKDHPDRAGTL